MLAYRGDTEWVNDECPNYWAWTRYPKPQAPWQRKGFRVKRTYQISAGIGTFDEILSQTGVGRAPLPLRSLADCLQPYPSNALRGNLMEISLVEIGLLVSVVGALS